MHRTTITPNWECTTLNAERYVKMMKERVFDALCRKFPDASLIRVQQDGASCHTGKKKNGEQTTTRKLNAIRPVLTAD